MEQGVVYYSGSVGVDLVNKGRVGSEATEGYVLGVIHKRYTGNW